MEKNANYNESEGFCMTQYEMTLTQLKAQLKPAWVLLDTQSSCNIFNNQDLLENIVHNAKPSLKLYSNGYGFIETNMKGNIRGD